MQSMRSKNELLQQFTEKDDEIFGDSEGMNFKDDVDTLKVSNLNISPSFQITPKQSSPRSKASSGKRITKETLSEYSDETDLTDFISEEEFDWDQRFNKTQNIYQQMNQRLVERKIAQQKQSEQETIDFGNKRKKNYDPNQTLKLKDFNKLTDENLSILDQLENEKTINYDYTKDDHDEFQDGFDIDLDKKLNRPLKKFHSMNLGPKYNDQVINKLNRIPSFYNKEKLEKYKESQQPVSHRKIHNITKLSSPISSSKMKFNNKALRWEGNEEDLIRFQNTPCLVSQHELKKPSNHGNMIYDKVNMRWINTDEDQDDVFDIPDLKVNHPPKKSQSMRGLSQYTQRTTSTASLMMEKDDFKLSSRLIERFNREESKIDKKISHWFQGAIEYKNDYYWEIRKMVMEE